MSDEAGARHRGEKAHCATPADLGTPFPTELRVSTLENTQRATVCSTRLRRCFQAFTAPAADSASTDECRPSALMHPLGYQPAGLSSGEMPRRNQTRQPSDSPKPPTAAFSPLFQMLKPLCLLEGLFGIAGSPRSSAERSGLPLNTDQSMTG